MTRYSVLDVPVEKNVVREVNLGSTVVRGALSPLDFPEKLRVAFDDATPQRVTVDFVYAMAPEEPVEARRPAEGGRILVGRKTGRILRLELQVPQGAPGLRLFFETEVQPVLNDLRAVASRTHQPPRRLAHYDMVNDMLPWLGEKLKELRAARGSRNASEAPG
jgi:hypothetical protein